MNVNCRIIVNALGLIFQWEIHERKLHQMYSFIKVGRGHHVPEIYLFGMLCTQQCVLWNKDSRHRSNQFNQIKSKRILLFIRSMKHERHHKSMTWKRLMQTSFDSDQDIRKWLTSRQWCDHLRSLCMLVMDTFNTCSKKNVHFCDFSENFTKLSM